MENQNPTGGKRYSYLNSEIEAAYHEAALKFKLSDSALRILYAICLRGNSCPLGEVVRLSGIRKQTVNSSLRKLEEAGILYLTAADGKRKKVRLTEKGEKLADDSARFVLDAENSIFSSWTPAEQELYLALTERFLREFKAKIKEIPA